MKALKDTRVLVIDDYKWMTRTMRGLLRRIDVRQVTEAHDGTQAMALLDGGGLDLALCNHVLNCPDGLDVLRMVRARPSLANLPFVLYTLDRSPGTLEAMRRAGASGCLYKPITEDALRRAVDTALAAHGGPVRVPLREAEQA